MAITNIQNQELPSISEVYHPYIEAGAENHDNVGYFNQEEVVAALGVVATGNDYTEIEIDGEVFPSWRLKTRVTHDKQHPTPAKGGIRYDPEVTREEVETLAVTMDAKNILFGLPFAGGKGGIAIDRTTLKRLDVRQRHSLDQQHALAHGYDPYTNVGAPDIGTTTEDMDEMIDALESRFGQLAQACFTGASTEHGGLPEFRAPATGLGAVFVLDEYLREEARHNPLIRKIIEGDTDEKISVITQGNGKAGAPFSANLPSYAGLKAVMEANGSIRAKHGFLDPTMVTQLARHSLLSAETPLPRGVEWVDTKEFWKTPAHIVVPAARDLQITSDVVRGFHDNVIAVLGIANNPTTAEARELLEKRQIDDIVDRLANAGGVCGSFYEWAKSMYVHGGVNVGWNPDTYVKSWENQMRNTARTVFRATRKARHETQRFIPISHITDRQIVIQAVSKYRQAA